MSLFNFLMINTAIALIGVGCAFLLGKPGIFMKNAAGTLSIGCQLSIVDYKRFISLGIKSTLDLTSEFGEVGFIRTGQNYLSIPLLDTTVECFGTITKMTNGVRIMKKNRQFIRHPTEIPIELWCMAKSCHECKKRLSNISLGGLAFESGTNWQPGTIIGIRIPLVDPSFKTTARVVWCHKKTTRFEIGVELTEPNDAFRTRMVEQICQIEHYRKTLELQGRMLNIEDAATEWISHYAAEFPLFKNDSAQTV